MQKDAKPREEDILGLWLSDEDEDGTVSDSSGNTNGGEVITIRMANTPP
jgi:hypothetical protein